MNISKLLAQFYFSLFKHLYIFSFDISFYSSLVFISLFLRLFFLFSFFFLSFLFILHISILSFSYSFSFSILRPFHFLRFVHFLVAFFLFLHSTPSCSDSLFLLPLFTLCTPFLIIWLFFSFSLDLSFIFLSAMSSRH